MLVRVVVGERAEGEAARAELEGADLHAPELIDLEVASTLRRLERAGALPPAVANQALSLVATAPVLRHPHLSLLPRVWQLRQNLTPYDAAYAALAELLDATLVTADGGLATAPGPRCARTHLT